LAAVAAVAAMSVCIVLVITPSVNKDFNFMTKII